VRKNNNGRAIFPKERIKPPLQQISVVVFKFYASFPTPLYSTPPPFLSRNFLITDYFFYDILYWRYYCENRNLISFLDSRSETPQE